MPAACRLKEEVGSLFSANARTEAGVQCCVYIPGCLGELHASEVRCTV